MYTHFDENFWTSRYLQGRTEWDAGSIAIPIKQYLDQISTKDVNILIAGAVNGHEAAYAHKMHELLRPSGKLVGVLFEGELGTQCPPFG